MEKKAHEHLEWGTVSEFEQDAVVRSRKQSKVNAFVKASDQVAFEDAYSEIKVSRGRTPFCLMTINPRPGVKFDAFEQAVIGACDDYFIWYAYSFEIRQAPDQGLHCHVLAQIRESKQGSNFSRIKDRFCPLVCGNKQHIDIRYVQSDEIEKVFDYIQKTKVAKSKKSAVTATHKWRSDNNIEPIYTMGDLPTCLVPPDPSLIKLN